ncbi:MAG TPA: HupE/UreJ family protein, partial [Albitalea sp.]|nr:HupE/UreJ family protein [Albitalea sp.]
VQRIRREPGALAQWVARTHQLLINGAPASAQVRGVRVYPRGSVPPFNTLEQAHAATAPGPVCPDDAAGVDVAYVIVDTHLFYPHDGAIAGFEFASPSGNRGIGQPEIQNLLVDHVGDRSFIYRRVGPLAEPVQIDPSAWQAARSFTSSGLRHVTAGLDHLLFVLCISLGASSLATLLLRVSAFTLGHSISLAIGFYGHLPQQAWFMPAVETAIAASIMLAAAALILRHAPARTLTPTIAAVGLVHGLGFSFGLRELLDPQGPHGVLSLASFNVGVELAQAVFAALAFATGAWLAARSVRLREHAQRVVGVGCGLVALLWTVERGRLLLA